MENVADLILDPSAKKERCEKFSRMKAMAVPPLDRAVQELKKQPMTDKPSSADLKKATPQQAGKTLAQALGPVHELFGAGDVKKVRGDNTSHFLRGCHCVHWPWDYHWRRWMSCCRVKL